MQRVTRYVAVELLVPREDGLDDYLEHLLEEAFKVDPAPVHLDDIEVLEQDALVGRLGAMP